MELANATQKTLVSMSVIDSWTKYIDVKPQTAETYQKCIKRFILYLRENNITAPTRQDILDYKEYLSLSKRPTTVQVYLATVKLFFSWLAQNNIYPNIAEHVKGAKISKEHKKDYLTSRQAKGVLEAIDRSTLQGKRDYAMIFLMLSTGIRTVEVLRANIGDIRTVGDFLVLYIQGKGRDEKAEYVKIAEPVEGALREYLSCRADSNQEQPLFTSIANHNKNGRLTTRSISRIIKNAFLKVGLTSDRLTAHSLRHTAATLNLLNGATIEETQQLLRHTSINTTLIYSHALERANNESEARIANAINNV